MCRIPQRWLGSMDLNFTKIKRPLVKNDNSDFFIAFLCDNYLEKLIFWEYKFLQTEKKIYLIVTTESKIAWSRKWPPDQFYCIFVWQFSQNLEFSVFPNHFPTKNIPKNRKIILWDFWKKSRETLRPFGKSLVCETCETCQA